MWLLLDSYPEEAMIFYRHRSFRGNWCFYLLVVCVTICIVQLFVARVGDVEESWSLSQQAGEARDEHVCSAESSLPVRMSVLKTLATSPQPPSGFTQSTYEVLWNKCCSRLLVDPQWKPGASCWQSVEKLHLTNQPGIRRLFPVNLDLEPLQYMLKNTPVNRVQLFSNQDGWFHHSLVGSPSHDRLNSQLSNRMTSLPDTGSTHKWLVILEGGQRAIFKPKW